MRLGVSIEYEGKSYDILELPYEVFVHVIPGISDAQYRRIDRYFENVWHEPTLRRNHIIQFAADLSGTTMDFLIFNRERLDFDETDLMAYVEHHTKQGHRPS